MAEYDETNPVMQKFMKKYPFLEESANLVKLSKDGKTIFVYLYDDVALPKTFEGKTVKGYI